MDDTLTPWQPWESYPAFTAERLSLIATELRDARDDALNKYEPLKGETNWSLGSVKYDRSKFCLRQLAKGNPAWLGLVSETSAQRCTVALEGVPIRFFHQSTEDPPAKYTEATDGEQRHYQLLFKVDGVPFRDTLYRLAIKDFPDGKVESITLVEFDGSGASVNEFAIPFGLAPSNILPLQGRPVNSEPIYLEPMESEEQDEKLGNDEDDKSTGTD